MAVVKSKPKPDSSSGSSPSRSTSPNVKREAEESSEEGPEEESGSESGSESSSGSGSDSESESDEESEKKETDTTSNQQPTKKSANVSFVEPQAFKPPSGFKSAKKQSSSSNVSSLLSNLRGKQVFHITAPSFLPLSKVKEVSLGKVLQGEPVLKHDGVNYGIPMDSISQGETDGQTLLLHDPKSQSYYNTPTSNIQSYHVQEMVNLPDNNGTGSISAQDYEKPPRKQPKHLKMRFRPVGSGDVPAETIGSSSDESDGEEEKPTFKVPKGSSTEKEERKRKHHHTEGEEIQPNGLPRKKSKKQSASHEAGGDKMDVDEKKSKKSSRSRDEKKRKKAEKA